MIVRGGADHTVTRVITNSCPMPGAAAHRHAAGPWPASPASTGRPQPGAVYAQPSASTAPHGSHGPASQSGAKAPELVASAHPDDGFGDFSVPGSSPGPTSGDPADAGPAPADPQAYGGPSDPSVGLLDPPGAIGTTRTNTSATSAGGTPGTGTGGTPGTGTGGTPGTSTGGQIPIGPNGNHQIIASEPSTLALFLAGTAALGFALRRRRRPARVPAVPPDLISRR